MIGLLRLPSNPYVIAVDYPDEQELSKAVKKGLDLLPFVVTYSDGGRSIFGFKPNGAEIRNFDYYYVGKGSTK